MVIFLKGVLKNWEFSGHRNELRESLISGIFIHYVLETFDVLIAELCLYIHSIFVCASVAHTENVKLTLVLKISTVQCWEFKKRTFYWWRCHSWLKTGCIDRENGLSKWPSTYQNGIANNSKVFSSDFINQVDCEYKLIVIS